MEILINEFASGFRIGIAIIGLVTPLLIFAGICFVVVGIGGNWANGCCKHVIADELVAIPGCDCAECTAIRKSTGAVS